MFCNPPVVDVYLLPVKQGCMMDDSNRIIKCDERLVPIIDFVCKTLDVTRDDFSSLAMANLLEEELDWIQENSQKYSGVAFEKIERFRKIIEDVKLEASFIITK
jgi:hypothetical protein